MHDAVPVFIGVRIPTVPLYMAKMAGLSMQLYITADVESTASPQSHDPLAIFSRTPENAPSLNIQSNAIRMQHQVIEK